MNTLSTLVDAVHALTETEEVLVGIHLHLIIYAVLAARCQLLVEHLSRSISHLYAPGSFLNAYLQLAGLYLFAVHAEVHLREVVVDHHPLLIIGHLLCRHLGYTEHAFRTHLDAHVALRRCVEHAVSFHLLCMSRCGKGAQRQECEF